MFDVNDDIVYGGYSVCKITGTTKRALNGDMLDYYILKPAFDKESTIFVPMHNENLVKKMHRVLSKIEIDELIELIQAEQPIWIDDESERKELFREILTIHDRRKIVGVIKSLKAHQREQIKKKRRLHISDEKFLKEAEKSLREEVAFVLEIDPSDASELIEAKMTAEVGME